MSDVQLISQTMIEKKIDLQIVLGHILHREDLIRSFAPCVP